MAYPYSTNDSNATIGTTERSIVGDTTTSVPLSNNGSVELSVMLDLSALAAGDEFELRYYSKVDVGTQRTLAVFSFSGAYSELFYAPPIRVYDAYDVTLKKIAGTDRAIRWAVDTNVGDVNVAATTAMNDDEGEVWPRVFKQSESTTARRTIFFYVLSVASGTAQGYKRNNRATEGAASVAAMMSATIGKNGGAAVAVSGTFAEVDSVYAPGLFSYEFTAGELDTLGYGTLYLAGSGASGNPRSRAIHYSVVSADVFDAVRQGMTALPNAAAEAAGGLYTRGTGAGQIRQVANGLIDANVMRWNDTAVATPTTAGVPRVDVKAMEANVLTATAINTGAITNAKFAAGAIDATAIASNAITSAKIATDAIGAAQIAADAIGSSELAATAVTEIQTGLATSASITVLQADTDDIQTRLPAALVGGRMDSSVGAMASNVLTAAALATDAVTEIADAIFNYVVENSKTFLHYVRIMKSGVAGKMSISGSNRNFRDDADTKDRIAATADATGRTTVTVDGT